MASASTREELKKFRFVTSHRPVPWALIRSINIAQHRTQPPQLDVLSKLSSEICDLNLDMTNLGLMGFTAAAGGAGVGSSATSATTGTTMDNNIGGGPTATEVVQLCHSLQVALQFSLFSQSCMVSQLRSMHQTSSVNNISSATLTTMEAKLDAAQATITVLKEANRAVNEELSQRHLKVSQGERDVEVLKAKLQSAEDQLVTLRQQLGTTNGGAAGSGGESKKSCTHRSGSRHGHSHRHSSCSHSRKHHHHHHHDPSEDISNTSSISAELTTAHHRGSSSRSKAPPSGGPAGNYVDWASFASLMLTQQQQQQHQPHVNHGAAPAAPSVVPASSLIPAANPAQQQHGGATATTTTATLAVTHRLDHLDDVTNRQNSSHALITEKLQQLSTSQATVSQTMEGFGQQWATQLTQLKDATSQGFQSLHEDIDEVKERQEFLEENQKMLSAKVNNAVAGGGGALTKPPLATTPTSYRNESVTFGVVNTGSMKRPPPLDEEVSFGELHHSVSDNDHHQVQHSAMKRGSSTASPHTMTCEFCQADFPQGSFSKHVAKCSQLAQERQEASHQDAAGQDDDEVPFAGPPKCVHCRQPITVDNVGLEDSNACSHRCTHCRQRYPCYEVEMHEGECDLRFIPCKQCGASICAKLMKDHLSSVKCAERGGTGSSVGGTQNDLQSSVNGGPGGMGQMVSTRGGSTINPGGSTINSSSSQAGGILPKKESDLEIARRELKELLAEEAAEAVAKRRGSPRKEDSMNNSTQEPMD